MESWRKCFRDGFVPLLSNRHLEVLAEALQNDDPRLLQGATCSPPPMIAVQDFPVEAACLVGYCGWMGDELETVGEVEEFFARFCFAVDERLGEPAGCRHALNDFDEKPRSQMRIDYLSEVRRAISERRLQDMASA